MNIASTLRSYSSAVALLLTITLINHQAATYNCLWTTPFQMGTTSPASNSLNSSHTRVEVARLASLHTLSSMWWTLRRVPAGKYWYILTNKKNVLHWWISVLKQQQCVIVAIVRRRRFFLNIDITPACIATFLRSYVLEYSHLLNCRSRKIRAAKTSRSNRNWRGKREPQTRAVRLAITQLIQNLYCVNATFPGVQPNRNALATYL